MTTAVQDASGVQFSSSETGLARERLRAWADGTGMLLGVELGLQATAEWPFGLEAAGVILALTLFSALLFGTLLWAYPFSWQRSEITVGDGEIIFVKGDRRRALRPSDLKRITIGRSPDRRHSQVKIRDAEGETYWLFDPENVDGFSRWAVAELGDRVRQRRLWPVEYSPMGRGIATALLASLAAMAPLLWM